MDLLLSLLQTSSVSGAEGNVIQQFDNYLSAVSTIKHDALGNSYAFLKDSSTNILLEAHIDNVGYQVTYIDDKGYLYIRPVGGADIVASIGSYVVVETIRGDYILGIMGKTPIHLLKPEDRNRIPDMENIFIDCGLNPADVTKQISIGAHVGYYSTFQEIGDNLISAAGLDDKVGVYCIAKSLYEIYNANKAVNICAMAAVQEEIGCKGAQVAVNNVHPDKIICVDVCFASDTPDISPKKMGDIHLGMGPILSYNADNDKNWLYRAEKLAEEYHIPIQKTAYLHATGGTDTARMQLSERGTKTLLISIPCRYMHTAVEVCNKRDIEWTIQLLKLLCSE